MDNLKSEKTNSVLFTDIEKVRFLIHDATGLKIMYAYENLVFAEHGLYLIEVDPTDSDRLSCYFNVDFDKSKRLLFLERLIQTASLNGMTVLNKGAFEMKQNPTGENFTLTFLD